MDQIGETVECPACAGTGQLHKEDKTAALLAVWVHLSDYDRQEVILYATFLKQRRAEREGRAASIVSD